MVADEYFEMRGADSTDSITLPTEKVVQTQMETPARVEAEQDAFAIDSALPKVPTRLTDEVITDPPSVSENVNCVEGLSDNQNMNMQDETRQSVSSVKTRFVYPNGRVRKVILLCENGEERFAWERFDDGSWVVDNSTQDLDLYYETSDRLAEFGVSPEVVDPHNASIIFYVGGESEVRTLAKIGFAAVSLPNGVEQTLDEHYSSILAEIVKGKTFYAIANNDKLGWDYAITAANAMSGIASEVKILDITKIWADCPKRGDISGFFALYGKTTTVVMLANLSQMVPVFDPNALPIRVTEDANMSKPPIIVPVGPRIRYGYAIKSEDPKFLLYPYIQIGKGNMIQGMSGVGKTFLACAFAAHVTSGKPLLGIPVEYPGRVIIFCGEDEASVIRKRVLDSGGNEYNLLIVDNFSGITFNDPIIETFITRFDARLVVMDPIQLFLGARTNMNRANETRPVLQQFIDMCNSHSCAPMIISHIGKSAIERPAIMGALGSVDIAASMRTIGEVTEDPANSERRLFVPIKSSNTRPGKTIVYETSDNGVIFHGFSDYTVSDLNNKRPIKGSQSQAEEFILSALIEAGGKMLVANLDKEAKKLGFSTAVLGRAKSSLYDAKVAVHVQENRKHYIALCEQGADTPLKNRDEDF
ncbi:MAG: AAA family ATPase [Oscillospiraceae bacterium]|nr:AAA family ATPase [Oscillospiraceae bacterium]